MDTGRKHTSDELIGFLSNLYDALNDGFTDAERLREIRERLKAHGIDVAATISKAKELIQEPESND